MCLAPIGSTRSDAIGSDRSDRSGAARVCRVASVVLHEPSMSRIALLAALGFVACGGGDSITHGADSGGAEDAGDVPSIPGDGGSTEAGDAGVHNDGGAPRADGGGDAGFAKSHKRGIAYGQHSDADLRSLSAGIGWWYNWSPRPEGTLSAGAAALVEFVPMIWGGSFDPATLAAQVPASAKYLLTFNEPNFGTQSNLTPQQAAALWPKVEAFAKSRGLKIVSPGLNYCGGNCINTNPFDWLDQFFAACANCQVDYVAAHWYACSTSALTDYLAQYQSKYRKPLWLTEFSCLDDSVITPAKELQYMREAVALLEANPNVFRYAWFSGRFSQEPAIDLLSPASGVLSPLGRQYVALPGAP